jgi:hypothetical protein
MQLAQALLEKLDPLATKPTTVSTALPSCVSAKVLFSCMIYVLIILPPELCVYVVADPSRLRALSYPITALSFTFIVLVSIHLRTQRNWSRRLRIASSR